MQREIITTADGSKTIHLVDWDEHYHSIHGAIQEANHVFIKHGLLFFVENKDRRNIILSGDAKRFTDRNNQISILEIGFGTGLNAFITLLEAEKLNLKIDYVGVEAFPISAEELSEMNYASELNSAKTKEFEALHHSSWEGNHHISSHFSLIKQKKSFGAIEDQNQYDLIYFDAFGARVQPELWTEIIFKKMHDALKPNGILVTYSAKGSVRRAMQTVGFQVEKLPGPPGKREMLRAIKV